MGADEKAKCMFNFKHCRAKNMQVANIEIHFMAITQNCKF